MEDAQRSTDSNDVGQLVDRAASFLEVAIYTGVSLALVAGSTVLLVDAVITYLTHVGGDAVLPSSVELLSSLLLVFVFVELLGATRVTIREKRLIAEPFLLVGIIASIKEIVIVAGAEDPAGKSFDTFRNGMVEIGVLSGVVLLLSISALLLRRREREPDEESAAT